MRRYKFVLLVLCAAVYQFDIIVGLLMCPLALPQAKGTQLGGLLSMLFPEQGPILTAFMALSLFLDGIAIMFGFSYREQAVTKGDQRSSLSLALHVAHFTFVTLSFTGYFFVFFPTTSSHTEAVKYLKREKSAYDPELAFYCVLREKWGVLLYMIYYCIFMLFAFLSFVLKSVYTIKTSLKRNEQHLSEQTLRLQKMLLRALLWQAFGPFLLFCIPIAVMVASLLIIPRIDSIPGKLLDDILRSITGVVFIAPSFFSTCHFVTVIYFTTPYKAFVLNILPRGTTAVVSLASQSGDVCQRRSVGEQTLEGEKRMRFSWKVTTFLLCCYGFFKEFKPSEPYLYEYEHVTLNISEEVLNSKVYPIWTYSYLVMLIPTFILTDLFLYKPVLIFEALSYIIVWLLFVFGRSVLVQQLIELFYGWATATEIAYQSYIYVKVEKEQFKKVTSITQAALQAGRFSAYGLSQLIILLKWGSYQTLNWISLISLFVSLPFALILPMVPWRRAYEKKLEARGVTPDETATYSTFAKMHFRTILSDFKLIYSDLFVAKWSLWWAFASCAFYQIGNYSQILWGTIIDVHNQNVYNGFTEAAVPLLCIPVVLLMQKLTVDWPKWGELCLTVLSLFQGGLLLMMALTNNLFVMYTGYILYRILYQGMITIAQKFFCYRVFLWTELNGLVKMTVHSELVAFMTSDTIVRFNIAERLASYSYGLVFGFNTFIALVLQSILTIVVVEQIGFGLSIKPQFIVYSCYHFVLSLAFGLAVALGLFQRSRHRRDERLVFGSETINF